MIVHVGRAPASLTVEKCEHFAKLLAAAKEKAGDVHAAVERGKERVCKES